MTDKEKLHQVLSSLWKNDDSVGKVYYNQALQDVQTAIDSLQEEPVSEDKELAETYLAVFNKKFPILPSLKGKQLADYKNFLNKCQQIFGLKEWGIHPIQSKLFEKLTLLWAVWGAEHLQGVGRQDEKEQDIPVNEDLEKISYYFACMCHPLETAYSKTSSNPDVIKAFKAGAKWKEEQDKKLCKKVRRA